MLPVEAVVPVVEVPVLCVVEEVLCVEEVVEAVEPVAEVEAVVWPVLRVDEVEDVEAVVFPEPFVEEVLFVEDVLLVEEVLFVEDVDAVVWPVDRAVSERMVVDVVLVVVYSCEAATLVRVNPSTAIDPIMQAAMKMLFLFIGFGI